MKIEERAKETYPKGVGIFTPEGAELLQKAYIRSATEQREIDITKACEWLKTNYVHFDGKVEDFVADFRKAMEE